MRPAVADNRRRIAAAAAHLRDLMASMYEGRSVRSPEEFKADLAALRVACETLEKVAAGMPK